MLALEPTTSPLLPPTVPTPGAAPPGEPQSQGNQSERSRIHAKQHKPKNQTEQYALTTEEVLGFGKKLQEFWEKRFQKLAHSAALRAASKRGKPLQTYGQRRKKRKIQSGLAVSV